MRQMGKYGCPSARTEPFVLPALKAFDLSQSKEIDNKQLIILLFSILIVALCGIAYELIIGTISTYLLGNSVYQFSITIGLFMFAMGLGSLFSKYLAKNLVTRFIAIELIIAIIGGMSGLILFVTFPFVKALYTSVMFTLIIVIGTLVGLEIPILTRIISRRESIRNSIAHVLTLDYIGALIGSVLFPLFLLPHLGLIRSSFAIGLINLLTGIVNIHYFRHHIKHPYKMYTCAFVMLFLLSGMTVFGAWFTSFAERHLYFDQILFQKQTPYQRLVYTQSFDTEEHRLYIDGHVQFSDRDEYRYHEALVHPIMSMAGPREMILILGGGDGLAAREVLKYPGVTSIHLVDIDPAITEFCSTFPDIVKLNEGSLKHPKVTIFNTDAFSFANQPGLLYDCIIIDLPDPHNEALCKLYSREFYTILKHRMKPNGFLVTQSSSPFYTRKSYWSVERTIAAGGFSTFSYQITIPSFGLWGFHLASAAQIESFEFDINVKTKYLSNQIMTTAGIFGKDIDRVDAPINSLMEPKLYILYNRELQKGT